jgi:chemotaxis protein MotB
MSAATDQKRPIVIKRIAAHEDEHGGQWKVAYADFVTAMMAFFLIMWLLSSTTSNDRQVIAKYFNSTTIFDLPSGNGILNGGTSVMDGSDAKPTRGAPAGKDNKQRSGRDPAAKPVNKAADKASDADGQRRDPTERQRFEAIKAELEQMMVSGELKVLAQNLDISLTPDGLRIQIFDRDGQPMFAPGGAEPLPRLKAVLGVIAQVLDTVDNNVIIAGYTDAQTLQRGNYSNWELSADRANSVRRTLETDGLSTSRVTRVEGRGSTDLLYPYMPMDPRNRRISVTILKSDLAPDPQ